MTFLNSTSTATLKEHLHQHATITTNCNNTSAYGLTISSMLPTIRSNTMKLDAIRNTILPNSFLMNDLSCTVSTSIDNILSTSHSMSQLQSGSFEAS